MRVFLNKFGTTLISRQAGKEALAAFQPVLNSLSADERLELDFDGVITFSPSWGDEFLTPLQKQFPERLFLINIKNNPSVVESLAIIAAPDNVSFNILG